MAPPGAAEPREGPDGKGQEDEQQERDERLDRCAPGTFGHDKGGPKGLSMLAPRGSAASAATYVVLPIVPISRCVPALIVGLVIAVIGVRLERVVASSHRYVQQHAGRRHETQEGVELA